MAPPSLPPCVAPGYIAQDGACKPCQAGTFEVSNLICQPADSLSYVVSNASTASDVILCPPNTRVLVPLLERGELVLQIREGADSLDKCQCLAGFYRPPSVSIENGCVTCADGTTCLGAHFLPFANDGYGKISSNTSAFLKCTSGCTGGGYSFNGTGIEYTAELVEARCDNGYKAGSALCSLCDEDNGYALQMTHCSSCTMGEGAYIFFGICMVLIWFPLQRVLITRYVRSLYTTTSFVQYLGFYSYLRISWSSNVKALFEG